MSKKWKIGLGLFAGLMVFGAVDRFARPEYYKELEMKQEQERKVRDEERAKVAAAEVERKAKEAEEKARQKRIGSESDARFYAREFVKRVLKSPKSAEFSEDTAVLNNDDAWSVKGYVDFTELFRRYDSFNLSVQGKARR